MLRYVHVIAILKSYCCKYLQIKYTDSVVLSLILVST